MTPCPKCDEIWLYRTENGQYRVNCNCGHAWNWSSPVRTKKEAKENWERFMEIWSLHKTKEPKE